MSTVRSRIGRGKSTEPQEGRGIPRVARDDGKERSGPPQKAAPTRARGTQEPVFPVRNRDAHTAEDRPLQKKERRGGARQGKRI